MEPCERCGKRSSFVSDKDYDRPRMISLCTGNVVLLVRWLCPECEWTVREVMTDRIPSAQKVILTAKEGR